MRSARIRFTEEAASVLVDGDFLQEGRCINADYEGAAYRFLSNHQ
jgi:hypothetical protein